MRILGVSGSLNSALDQWVPGLPRTLFHDAAAALVEDGHVVAAVEEERRSRIKHTRDFPLGAIDACLTMAGVDLDQVDEIVFYFAEDYLDNQLAGQALLAPELSMPGARARLAALLGLSPDDERILFMRHHLAHAASAFYESGLGHCAVLVMDGHGETEAVSTYTADEDGLSSVASWPDSASLGQLYLHGTRFLGFRLFDEYKVMGLAPYGDATRYRALFADLYELLPDGQYRFDHRDMDDRLLTAGIRPRRQGEGFDEEHRDFAAALQETLEVIVLHVVRDLLAKTGEARLCLAGGVAQNSTLNGVLARSGLCEEMFVHPAAHDAGAALGAALYRSRQHRQLPPRRRMSTTLGTDLGPDDRISAVLGAWSDNLRVERCDDVATTAATMLADGAILGWAQGRAEFGPRALGQRSIIADPRPVSNRERVNELIKRREEFRPLAPAVLAARAAEFFELPQTRINGEFMNYTVPVRPQYRELLAAVTHIDGSARIQVVPDRSHPFTRLISGFAERSGVPVILNTSFNNDSEPIVDTVDDVVRGFLTSELDGLVIGSFLITRPLADLGLAELAPILLATSAISRVPAVDGTLRWQVYEWAHPHDRRRRVTVAPATADLLARADGRLSAGALGVPDDGEVITDLRLLWHRRLIDMRPVT